MALTVISVGIIGTLSMVGANRALMESTWDMARMNLIADSVMNELSVVSQRGESLPATGTYDWSTDSADLTPLFIDNGFTASASTMLVATATAPGALIDVTLTLKSPTGRSMQRVRTFYEDLK